MTTATITNGAVDTTDVTTIDMPPIKTKKSPKSAATIEEHAEKQQALNDALAQIERSYGKGAVMRMEEGADQNIAAVSTGSLSLDVALGIGGLPRGRVIEIYGAESAGKSTLALSTVAQAQKTGGTCAYVDVEHALDPVYAKAIGVDIPSLLISQPDSAEQALEIVEYMVRSAALDVVVLDSVAALVPNAELEGDMGDSHPALQARLMSQAMRKLTGVIHKTDTVCIFINQLREKIGVVYGNPETQPGGRALKFYSSVRLDMRRKEVLKHGKEITGNRIRIRVVKNKVAPPFKQAEVDIVFSEGISMEGDLLELGVENNVLEKRGSFYNYGDTRLGQGRESARVFLREHPEVRDEIEDEVRRLALPNSVR